MGSSFVASQLREDHENHLLVGTNDVFVRDIELQVYMVVLTHS